MDFLLDGIRAFTWQQAVMFAVGFTLIWLAIKKQCEPMLLLPMGFGAILVNIPFSGALNQVLPGVGETQGAIQWLFEVGIESSEILPLLLFIGIGAMIDFSPLFQRPIYFVFAAAAHFGIFATIVLACVLGFDLRDAAAIGIIGAADGPTTILVAQVLQSKYMGAIAVTAYSYMALVPIIQPAVIYLLTSRDERRIRMEPTKDSDIPRTVRILFPIAVTIVVGLISPAAVSLIGFLMFGNLIRECGVLESLSRTAQNELTNLITLLLGIIIAFTMKADQFVTRDTIMILGLGLFAFICDTAAGLLFAKFLNLFLRKKINPMIGATGISAFPMSARVIHKLAMKEDPGNILIMQAVSANVAGQIASVAASGLVLSLVLKYLQ
ncbi:MAG: sodium ion-translocating decarboxylase subunit beta [Kiritimatiellae bacterium]|jgi:sodium ion-translocating decarboxylase beta subunit|nr:sodium ion-translocating decarboxylase subunit beta [Kiritimatiellia bacterium]MDD2348118.1 sodium ion-translocating decarboxylase subunit beta [Kiritimatiellia bacterium]MDD3584553.1 sodium ion-translocating decarboxylase subunit beta [Kiritimatiellia bacterium]HHU14952.1 sodium ion-translocating decarboxylase subunit beta [Lentisphaerota bacterium]